MKIHLQVQVPNGRPTDSTFEGPVLLIGRAPESQLRLTGEAGTSVSWKHARIELNGSGAILYDLESTNGTFLNGQRVQGQVRVKTGDQLTLGQTGPRVTLLALHAAAVRTVPPPQAVVAAPPAPLAGPADFAPASPAVAALAPASGAAASWLQPRWVLGGVTAALLLGLGLYFVVWLQQQARRDEAFRAETVRLEEDRLAEEVRKAKANEQLRQDQATADRVAAEQKSQDAEKKADEDAARKRYEQGQKEEQDRNNRLGRAELQRKIDQEQILIGRLEEEMKPLSERQSKLRADLDELRKKHDRNGGLNDADLFRRDGLLNELQGMDNQLNGMRNDRDNARARIAMFNEWLRGISN